VGAFPDSHVFFMMLFRCRFLYAVLMVSFSGAVSAHPPLQLYIQLTPPGGVLKLKPGTYSGPAVIKKKITIEGNGEATIDGGGEGSVIHIKADGSVIRGLHITHSGRAFDDLDAALVVEADGTLIEDNIIDDCLFGITLRNAAENTIRNNRISSVDEEVGLRGEGIRLWYSADNLIVGNELSRVRDMLIINSPDNHIRNNRVRNSRVGMEFVFSPGNIVEENVIEYDKSGFVGLYSEGLLFRGNHIAHLRDTPGTAFSIKESAQVRLQRNRILHCAVGLIANAPANPANILYLDGNQFAYNDVAIYFYGDRGGHVITGNRFEGNITTIAVSAANSAIDNDWRGNYWDDYKGFDLDDDGIGDMPHTLYLYADRLWMDRPMTRFFRASPVLETIDFMERLAPFSKPKKILQDPAPLTSMENKKEE